MRALVISCILFCTVQVIVSQELFNLGHIRLQKLPPPTDSDRKRVLVTTKYISQKVDHNDPSNTAVYDQRYMVNTEYYNTSKGNFAFVFIGGESEIAEEWMSYGSFAVTSEKYGALQFQLEHRYYGQSQPASDLSVDNLKYLSSEQALADLADFIVAMNKEYNLLTDLKWIVFGGSYAGSLAAWARLKYPDLIQGAVSHSAPLYAKFDFFEYYQVVANDVSETSSECASSVKETFNLIDEYLENPSEGNLTDIFHSCSDLVVDLKNDLEIANFYSVITNPLIAVTQYDTYRDLTIDDVCDLLTDSSKGTELERLTILLGIADVGSSCMSYKYSDLLDICKNIEITTTGILRQWLYQTCTEFGWFASSHEDNQVFGSRISSQFQASLCKGAFGSTFTSDYINAKIDITNSNYGGYDINATNIVYVHGSLDPWSPLGLLQTKNPDSPVIVVKGVHHCAAMYVNENNPDELVAAIDEVDRLVGVWLGVLSE